MVHTGIILTENYIEYEMSVKILHTHKRHTSYSVS
jgi:hypothetical protein